MSVNIYVGNLSWDANDQDLENLFAEYGEVTSARIITDKFSGQSKGFGFVEMSTGGQEAISALDGKEWMSRNIRVNVAEKRERRSNSY